MSIFKSNKFFRIIKHFILCLPLMFVLGTSLYAIVNSNAKDSYYGETINESENVFTDDLESGKHYVLLTPTHLDVLNNTGGSTETQIVVSSITDLGNSQYDFTNVNRIGFYSSSVNALVVYFYRVGESANAFNINAINTTIYIEFEVVSTTTRFDTYIANNKIFYYTIYNDYSYLNNAFEYGMYQFTQIGFGQFDFVSWFNGIFTTSLNNVYATFINDYINYYLFVEIVYFAPWVFHMFIHFAYDLGDYFTSSFKRNRKEDD